MIINIKIIFIFINVYSFKKDNQKHPKRHEKQQKRHANSTLFVHKDNQGHAHQYQKDLFGLAKNLHTWDPRKNFHFLQMLGNDRVTKMAL